MWRNILTEYWVLGFHIVMNLLLCHGFLEKIKSIFILKCPKSMLEYYFSKGFGILECNSNNLTEIPNLVKKTILAEGTYN